MADQTPPEQIRGWPETFAGPGAYSTAALCIMVDECFARAVHTACPTGRSPVTAELAIDFVAFAGSGVGSLHSVGEVLAASPGAALAHARILDAGESVVAAATTRCLFLPLAPDGDGRPGTAPKPPPDLPVMSMVETEPLAATELKATFTPDLRCANDLGFLHGGIAAAVLLEVGLLWLRQVYPDARASSIRMNLLRPNRLGVPATIAVAPLQIGRSIAVATITARDPSGRATVAATITGSSAEPHPAGP